MTQPDSPLLEVSGVSHLYGTSAALRDVTLEIPEGDFLSIVGPSGCGKSTLLKLMAGIISPSSGEVRFRGLPIGDLAPTEHGVLMMWQSLALFPHLNVGANVGFGLAVRGVDDATRRLRVSKALDLVELPEFESREIRSLSGGEQQRVALARALVLDPKVLLLDEPVGGLDRHLRARLIGTIRQLHHRLGVTMIMVTHEQNEALSLSTRIAVMHRGSIEQIGTPDEILNCPRTRFVGEFLGDRNVFTGHIIDVTGESATVSTAIGVLTASLPAWLPNSPAAGEKVAYVIDAHKMTIGGEHGENRLNASVEAVVTTGVLESVEFASSEAGVVKLQRPRVPGAARLAPGDRATLSWRTADAFVLPGQEGYDFSKTR